MGGFLGTVQLLNIVFGDLPVRFLVTKEDGAPLSTDRHPRRGIHSFFRILYLGDDPVPDFSKLDLLDTDEEGAVHLMD